MKQLQLGTMTITCRKCQHERITTFPQVEDKVTCPNCGLHGHMTISNSRTLDYGNFRIFISSE
jgi:Zn finger protein HypA/HybF involved in hydrogenase expression